ncbi:MAG: hypothetical protein ACRDR6_10830 [Pseudonocardiaceae bacterium]
MSAPHVMPAAVYPSTGLEHRDRERVRVVWEMVRRTGQVPSSNAVMSELGCGRSVANRVLDHLDHPDRSGGLPGPRLRSVEPGDTSPGDGEVAWTSLLRAEHTEGALAGQPTQSMQSTVSTSTDRAISGEGSDTGAVVDYQVARSRSGGLVGQSTPGGGRLVAWCGFVFGSVMSVAANVLHTWLPATHEPVGWWPGLAPQIGAATWPIALLISVEALSRITWPTGVLWGLARYAGAGTLAFSSALISYGHLRDVLVTWHYGVIPAAVGPLVLDGLMVVCGFGLLAIKTTQQPGEHNKPHLKGHNDHG